MASNSSRRREMQAGDAVGGGVHDVPARFEEIAHVRRDRRLVLDDQDSHGVAIVAPPLSRSPAAPRRSSPAPRAGRAGAPPRRRRRARTRPAARPSRRSPRTPGRACPSRRRTPRSPGRSRAMPSAGADDRDRDRLAEHQPRDVTGPKPSALSVAYSASRSRAVIAIVLAITARMMKITTNDTMRIATTIASVIATKPSWNAFSVSVSVSASELTNCASIARAISAERGGVVDLHHEHADLVGAPRRSSPSSSRSGSPSGRTSARCRSSPPRRRRSPRTVNDQVPG